MKKNIFLLFIFALFANNNLLGIVFESDDFTDILFYTEDQTLIVFDLDDTLIKFPSMLGSDAWVCHVAQQDAVKGLSFDEAIYNLLPRYYVIQNFTDLEVVDANAVEIISDLQRQERCVMALTARSLGFQDRTKKELRRLGYYFSITSPTKKTMDIGITHKALYSDGILFGGNNNKGELLFQLLDQIDYHPKKIIFIDDKMSHIEKMKKAVESRGIKFIGIRYSGSDERKKIFDPQLAHQELKTLEINLGMRPFDSTIAQRDIKEKK